MPAAAGVDDAREAEAVQLAVEVPRRVELILGRQLRELRDRRVEDGRVRLGVQDGAAAFDELVAPALGRHALRREPQRLRRRPRSGAPGCRGTARRPACPGAAAFSSATVGMRRSLNWYGDQPPMTRTHWPFGVRFACSRIICEPALQRLDAVPAQLEVVEAPAAHGVEVRVVQAGNDAPSARVDHARALAAKRASPRRRCPTATNFSPPDREGLRLGQLRHSAWRSSRCGR